MTETEIEASKVDTYEHIHKVQGYVLDAAQRLMVRALEHDRSKLWPPEDLRFAEVSKALKGVDYGSGEYKDLLAELKPALDHHYAHNRHHPEHHDSVDEMTLIDLLEMICDWKAASERHDSGDILKSIEINTERFGLSEQLACILTRTAHELFDL